MCSITGFITFGDKEWGLSNNTAWALTKILKASESRGRDGFGYTAFDKLGTVTAEQKWIDRTPEGRGVLFYQTVVEAARKSNVFIANHRAEPTTEFVVAKREADQQPYYYKTRWAVHNGTIANDKQLLANLGVIPPTSVDSYAIPVATYYMGVPSAIDAIKGSMAVLLYDASISFLSVYRNYKPLHIYWFPEDKTFIFSSMDNEYEGLGLPPARIFPPYTEAWGFSADGTFQQKTTVPDNRKRGLVVCSGGLDSVTAATIAKNECTHVTLLHFLYGCIAEKKEVEAVTAVALALNSDIRFVDMKWLKELGGSTLTEDGHISDGVSGAEFAHEWVPARNTAMLGIAASYADRLDVGSIYLGLNLEEGGAYPDNTVEFYRAFTKVLDCGTQARPTIINPLAQLTKREIVALAHAVKAPIHLAWSCYKGGDLHCGICGPCHMRRTAHKMLGLDDTIKYEE